MRGIELPKTPAGKITVLMDLQRSTHDIVKQDSVAAIQTEGVLGNEYISISFGSAARGGCTGRRHDLERASAGDGGPAEENGRHSGQQSGSCDQYGGGDRESEIHQRQDRRRPGDHRGLGERQEQCIPT